MFKLSQKSLSRMDEVHPVLKTIITEAIKISEVDFGVMVTSVRTLDQQKEFLKSGKSTTLNSRHIKRFIKGQHELGKVSCAVDLYAWVDHDLSWEFKYYEIINKAIQTVAKKYNVIVEWGGDWKTFKDGVHWQLSWNDYQVE